MDAVFQCPGAYAPPPIGRKDIKVIQFGLFRSGDQVVIARHRSPQTDAGVFLHPFFQLSLRPGQNGGIVNGLHILILVDQSLIQGKQDLPVLRTGRHISDRLHPYSSNPPKFPL